ncbi:MAG: triose-phosphate isomerase [Micropruina glycogenica]
MDDCRGKATAAARNGIVPILIAGEPTRGADPEQAIAPQLDTILGDVPCDFPVIVAYEPSWAIGQPQPAQAGHIAYTTGATRELLHARRRHNARIATAAAQWGTFSGIVEAADDAAQVPDGIFLGRSGWRRRTFWQRSTRCAQSAEATPEVDLSGALGSPGLPSFRRTPESPSLWITQRNLAAIVRCAA